MPDSTTAAGEGLLVEALTSTPKAPTAVAHLLPDDVVELIAMRFRALAEPTRIKLLDRLREGEAAVLELTELIGTSEQNISKHLGVLKRAGIVTRRKQGNFSYYSIADETVLALCEHVCGSLQEQLEALHESVGSAVARPIAGN
jgi:DNA-binding transcriptional ArsR family regulator